MSLTPVAKVTKELWHVKDFVSDLLVLCLALSQTVMSIMALPVSDTKSVRALCVTPFFMRVHLYAINCNLGLNAKTHVFFLEFIDFYAAY